MTTTPQATENATPFQLFPTLDAATDAALRESISRFGVLVPVAKDQHGRVLDGHQRSRIAGELGVDFRVDIHVCADDDEAREIAHTLNADRRQMSADQRRQVVAALREQGHSLRAIAGAVGVSQEQVRQDVAGVKCLTPPDSVVGKDGKRYKAKRTVVAAKSTREADRAHDALASLEQIPTGTVIDAQRVERIARQAEAELRRSQPAAAVVGEYGLIYADPPWRYDFAGTDNRKIENQYPTMSVDEICALTVPAADNSVLYLWATAPKLREALQVVDAWGFDYVTNAVWVKDKIGMGYWFRGRHELLLVGRRGAYSPPAESVRPDSVIEAPRLRHSQKPDVVYELLEQLYPGVSKIELFARNTRDGWHSWGNEA